MGVSRVRGSEFLTNISLMCSLGDASMTRADFLIGDNRDFQAILYDFVSLENNSLVEY